MMAKAFAELVLAKPLAVLLAVGAAVAFFVFHLEQFEIRAASDAIVLDDDGGLPTYEEARETFGSDEVLYVALRPEDDPLSDGVLEGLRDLVADLESIDGIAATTSILDVPLFHSPHVGLFELTEETRTIADESTDRELARAELVTSPIYRDQLISRDGDVLAIEVELTRPPEIERRQAFLDELRSRKSSRSLSPAEARELDGIEAELADAEARLANRRREIVGEIRSTLSEHADLGEIHLAGMPMIVVDIVAYLERDLVLFGAGVVLLAAAVLTVLFRRPRWILVPTVACLAVALVMVGLLGLLRWPATLVSSNFVSVLFILTMAMAVHVVVRHLEVSAGDAQASARELMARTVRYVAKPCLYTALTTIVGFASLYASRIRPVMDFAIMMVVGIALSYLFVFTLLPAAGVVGRSSGPSGRSEWRPMDLRLEALARAAGRRRLAIAVATVLVVSAAAAGIRRLDVDNRFIDYFDETTPIHRGMVFLDTELGGTAPLEILLERGEADAWLDKESLRRLEELHAWLARQPEIGKVRSLADLVAVLEGILATGDNPLLAGVEVDRGFLTMVRERLPEDLSRAVLRPYVDADFRLARVVARVRETRSDLDHQALIDRVEERLEKSEGLGTARTTGLFVLYNNVLQSLFRSQVRTVLAVFLAVFGMLWMLFRSAKLAVVGLLPNLLPVLVVLGTLGWVGIPLDMMTIMVAAVTLGIAADDTIHYLHRFRTEIDAGAGYDEAIATCHRTVGRAVLFTSVIVVAGFAVLAFSNFRPTVYFGLLTGLAMIVALAGALVLLPALLLAWRPVEQVEDG